MYLHPWRPRKKRRFWPWLLSLAVAFAVAWGLYTKQQEFVERVRGPLPTPTPTEISAREYLVVGDAAFLDGRLNDAANAYSRAT